jgi:hypothetical protein
MRRGGTFQYVQGGFFLLYGELLQKGGTGVFSKLIQELFSDFEDEVFAYINYDFGYFFGKWG